MPVHMTSDYIINFDVALHNHCNWGGDGKQLISVLMMALSCVYRL